MNNQQQSMVSYVIPYLSKVAIHCYNYVFGTQLLERRRCKKYVQSFIRARMEQGSLQHADAKRDIALCT